VIEKVILSALGQKSETIQPQRNTQALSMIAMMKLIAAMCAAIVLVGCADMPGKDGRYATHDRGALNRESRSGLPTTPYVPR
jgi:hypothetical protein